MPNSKLTFSLDSVEKYALKTKNRFNTIFFSTLSVHVEQNFRFMVLLRYVSHLYYGKTSFPNR